MHSPNEHKTAILVFALSSQEELRRKNIGNATALYKALSKHTLNTVQKTGLPYFHFTEKEQRGNTFGERFSNAIQAIYDKGFEQVITIGNDSPNLNTSHILESANLLSQNKVVLGPSKDGGFYLMGLHKANFNFDSFRRLPWKTSQLRNLFASELLLDRIELIQLRPLQDIDNVHDLKSILCYSSGVSLQVLSEILSLLKTPKVLSQIDMPLLRSYTLSDHHNRGSPFNLRN